MKKNVFHTAILLLTSVMMAACSGNDDIVNNTNPEPQAPTKGNVVVLSGTLGSKDSQTRTIATDGKGSWEEGDQFAIYYVTEDDGHASATATVNSINANGSANFTASLESPKTGNNGVTLIYPASAHDGNGGFETDALMEQEGTLDYINANGLDIETATTTMNVEGTAATLNSDVKMQPQVCLCTLNLRDGNYQSLSTTRLEIRDGMHTYTIIPKEGATTSFTVALLPTKNVSISFTATTTKETTIRTKRDGVTLANCTADNVGDVFDEDGNIYENSWGPGAIYYQDFSSRTLYAGRFYSSYVTFHNQLSTIAALGMIAYVGDHGTVDDSSTDPQTGFHGLAIAMNDFGGFSGYPWCSIKTADCTDDVNDNVTDAATACNTKNGINMTAYLVNHSGSNSHTHSAAIAAHSTSGHPSTTSDWFLPSVGQWQLIVWGVVSKATGQPYTTPITTELSSFDVIDNFNSILTQAGASAFPSSGCHWLSTEYSNGKAWAIAVKGYVFGHEKTYNSNIRRVLAF